MIKIWHNPRCSKSRLCLAYLEEEKIQTEVVKYLEDVPSVAELEEVLGMLGMRPRELMRVKETIYKELDLKNVTDDALLIKAMVENPKLIERPIVIKDGSAALGRPMENVIALLSS